MGETMDDMTQAELTALRADLLRAVQDRAKLLKFVQVVYDECWEGMSDTTSRIHVRGETLVERMAGWEKFSFLCDEAAKVRTEVEGAK